MPKPWWLLGATLIDVGGESTRPGARAVSPLEELERVAPIVERSIANWM
jgi:dihydropteroate synthase